MLASHRNTRLLLERGRTQTCCELYDASLLVYLDGLSVEESDSQNAGYKIARGTQTTFYTHSTFILLIEAWSQGDKRDTQGRKRNNRTREENADASHYGPRSTNSSAAFRHLDRLQRTSAMHAGQDLTPRQLGNGIMTRKGRGCHGCWATQSIHVGHICKLFTGSR